MYAMLKNITEVLVTQRLDSVLKKVRYEGCTCERCTEDMLSYALNHLPPRYVSTAEGELYARIQEMDPDYEFNVLREVAKAIRLVEEHPRHK